jgi:hypothetical protein
MRVGNLDGMLVEGVLEGKLEGLEGILEGFIEGRTEGNRVEVNVGEIEGLSEEGYFVGNLSKVGFSLEG